MSRPRTIRVKFASHPVTGAGRYRATGGGSRIHVQSDSAMSYQENRYMAAMVLAHRLGWESPIYQGETGDGLTSIFHA